jgi:guanine deaminase
MKKLTILRGSTLSFYADPFVEGDDKSYTFLKDALVFLEEGKITEIGTYQALKNQIPEGFEITDFSGHLITPGFIDTHVHYPQTTMIGAYGQQLLEWLTNYTFPTEAKFKDKEHARSVAKMFLKQTIKAGTTTSMVYGTVFKDSVNVFFEESEKLGTRMLCGKVLMDRNAPEEILDTAESGYNESKELIEKWHNNGRQLYVITPRFAPTSTREQLKLAGKLFNEYPDVFMQTHLCENEGEIAWVKELFPERKSYLDVYDYYGLVGKRAVFGHCVHFEDEDFETMSKKKAAISHCPTSNLFLGSGLFDLKKAKTGKHPVAVGLGTDLGAGTSFSQLQTLNEAYKIAEMRGNALTAIQGYFLATRGGAESLGLEDKIGSLEKGMEADITIWNLASTEIIDYRLTFAKDLEEKLFVQMILADDRSVHATYVNGEKVYDTKNNYYKLD